MFQLLSVLNSKKALKMNQKNGNSPQGYSVYFKNFAYICRQDIYYATRNRIDLFSRVKSGKFSKDENKQTYPNHTIMAWAVAYFSPPVYQSLHDKVSLRLTSLFYVPIQFLLCISSTTIPNILVCRLFVKVCRLSYEAYL